MTEPKVISQHRMQMWQLGRRMFASGANCPPMPNGASNSVSGFYALWAGWQAAYLACCTTRDDASPGEAANSRNSGLGTESNRSQVGA